MSEAPLSTDQWAFQQSPPSAGYWLMGGGAVRLHVWRRPRWLTRILMLWLLEWEWKETQHD